MSMMPSRRTRQREPEPDGTGDPPTGASESSTTVRGEPGPWEGPRVVFGEDRNHAAPHGAVGRPQAQWCQGRRDETGSQGPEESLRTRRRLGPGHTGLSRHRRMVVATGVEPGTVCRVASGRSSAVGHGRDRVRLCPAGGRWSGWTWGRRLTGRRQPGQDGTLRGSVPGACRPTGRLVRWKWNAEERLRGVDRFAGRLLGAVSASPDLPGQGSRGQGT